ncbi:hypothetical protein Zmor_001465 [Zophobas morio]|uniref:EGF-like calcium-binding domain-containing protein n=1 Tax=Zophobas morio TaxID=2755281 RepID=A0AA38J3S6_9CUCU|nr:hypothetical protein Zmor_001465 [Zophobas morio]
MSAGIPRCAFFAIVLRFNVIDCVSSSTSQHGTSTPSTIEDQQSPTTVTNSFTSHDDNTTAPLWLAEALRDIAYYLRAHKFNEYDRRYEPDAKLARREYYRSFPRPPLRSLHWEVHKYCDESLIECANYLRKRVKNTGLKRIDDTAAVIHEQQWNVRNNSKQIEIVNQDCIKMKEADDIQANPFEGPLERFQWRVTASYYLCWYTMKSHPFLEHLSDKCDNFANCLDPDFGPNNEDHRANDAIPYACALYSFCPDPCCPVEHLTRPENCWNMPDNPCFEANPMGQRECVVKRSQNTDFRDIILNRWNVSCSCPKKGFQWSSFYGICIDIDECVLGNHSCDPNNEMCLNLPGSFQCACKWGHTHDAKTGKCKASNALIHLILHNEEREQEKTNETLWSKFLRLFEEKSSSKETSVQTNLIIVSCTLVYFRV